jgi:hypothetical protein
MKELSKALLVNALHKPLQKLDAIALPSHVISSSSKSGHEGNKKAVRDNIDLLS